MLISASIVARYSQVHFGVPWPVSHALTVGKVVHEEWSRLWFQSRRCVTDSLSDISTPLTLNPFGYAYQPASLFRDTNIIIDLTGDQGRFKLGDAVKHFSKVEPSTPKSAA
ncbi:hypothetical protein NX059_012255 [Plenodomus lindquistii]|nr:hypothetical protein NX059_012255 [Plenodomus lindquistii]